MKFTPALTLTFFLPLTAVSAQPVLPGAGWADGASPPPVVPVQFRTTYEEFQPAPQLREFTDPAGNRVFVDQYGEVVSVVPPLAPQFEQPPAPQFEPQPTPRDLGVRRLGRVPDDFVVEQPAAPEDNGYNSFPPPPAASVERQPLPEPQQQPQPAPQPDFGSAPQPQEGPQPYTPPVIAEPAIPERPAIANKGTAEVAALQVFLDRAGASPGVIDGQAGSNVNKALDAYEIMTGSQLDTDDIDALMAELSSSGGLPIRQYTIAEGDVDGPFINAVPVDYAEKAELQQLSYTSPVELIAEKFHMDEGYLRAINPNADFSAPGTVIKVADTGANITVTVSRIVADKARKQVLAYDDGGRLVAAYPATIGSSSTPSPTGTHQVERIALDPVYTYNPKINFKQGDNDKVLTIPPGPNGPVGTVWIALSKPTYGIHGTPEPSTIGKTESNGCIRLTNWDAQELAEMVEPGVTVEFVDGSELLISESQTEEPALLPQQ